jgi:hypothetical protein
MAKKMMLMSFGIFFLGTLSFANETLPEFHIVFENLQSKVQYEFKAQSKSILFLKPPHFKENYALNDCSSSALNAFLAHYIGNSNCTSGSEKGHIKVTKQAKTETYAWCSGQGYPIEVASMALSRCK